MNREYWLPVTGYENSHMISSFGRLKGLLRESIHRYGGKRIVREKILNPVINDNGYYITNLKHPSKMLRIHRLVGKAFIPNPENKRCINHKNGIKTDNRVENLEWATHGENNLHAYKTGLKKAHVRRGEDNSSCKINSKIAIEIFNSLKEYSVRDISIKFNVTKHLVYSIKYKKSWKHVLPK